MPVLPAVPSTTVPPGLRMPRRSASSTIHFAARSLTEPPGFMNSALPRISQPVSSLKRCRRMRGVLPTAPTKPLTLLTSSSPRAQKLRNDMVAADGFGEPRAEHRSQEQHGRRIFAPAMIKDVCDGARGKLLRQHKLRAKESPGMPGNLRGTGAEVRTRTSYAGRYAAQKCQNARPYLSPDVASK